MGIEAEKSPCYLPGSSNIKSRKQQQNTNKQTPANTTTYKTKYKKILLYIYASKVTRILLISPILTGPTGS